MWPTRKALILTLMGLPLTIPVALVSQGFFWVWLVFYMALFLAVLVDMMWLPPRNAFTIDVDLPDTIPLGDAITARMSLRLLRRTRKGAVKVDLSDSLAPQAEQPVLLGPETDTALLVLNPNRRGPATLQTLWVRCPGPLGLLERVFRIPLNREILVTVNFPAVRRTAITCLRMEQFRTGPRIERFLGEGTEFDALKEYAPGLDSRRIDWKTSARKRKLFVRQYRAERNQHVVLALDTGRLMAEPIQGLTRMDHAIEAALLLAYVCLKSSDQVSTFCFDNDVISQSKPQKGARAMHLFLEVFSRLTYSDKETNYTYCLTQLLTRLTRRALVVVFTDFEDSITCELMCDNLSRLAERHRVLFVGLRDPAVNTLAKTRPRDALTLNRAILAGSLMAERDKVFKRLQRKGIWCVDAPPGPLSLDLVRRYIEIKRKELI